MKGFINNIEDLAVRNSDFRQVLYTAKHCQLVLMALKPKYTLYAPPNHRDDIVLDFPRLSRQMIMSEINQRKPVDGRLELAAGLKFDLKRSRIMVCGNPEMIH